MICAGFKNERSVKQKPTTKKKFVRLRFFKQSARNNIVIIGKSEIDSFKNSKWRRIS